MKHLVAVALLFATPATAEEFNILYLSKEISAFTKADIPPAVADRKNVWVNYVTREKGPDHVITSSREEFDCAGERRRILFARTFKLDGSVVEDTRDTYPWEFLVPDTIAYTVMRSICAGRKPNDERVVQGKNMFTTAMALSILMGDK